MPELRETWPPSPKGRHPSNSCRAAFPPGAQASCLHLFLRWPLQLLPGNTPSAFHPSPLRSVSCLCAALAGCVAPVAVLQPCSCGRDQLVSSQVSPTAIPRRCHETTQSSESRPGIASESNDQAPAPPSLPV